SVREKTYGPVPPRRPAGVRRPSFTAFRIAPVVRKPQYLAASGVGRYGGTAGVVILPRHPTRLRLLRYHLRLSRPSRTPRPHLHQSRPSRTPRPHLHQSRPSRTPLLPVLLCLRLGNPVPWRGGR